MCPFRSHTQTRFYSFKSWLSPYHTSKMSILRLKITQISSNTNVDIFILFYAQFTKCRSLELFLIVRKAGPLRPPDDWQRVTSSVSSLTLLMTVLWRHRDHRQQSTSICLCKSFVLSYFVQVLMVFQRKILQRVPVMMPRMRCHSKKSFYDIWQICSASFAVEKPFWSIFFLLFLWHEDVLHS